MYSEARITAAFQAMLAAIPAPPVPADAIRRRCSSPARPNYARFVTAGGALAAAAAVVLSLPAIAPGFTQNLEARIAAILRWTPPPQHTLELRLQPESGTLAAAQLRVAFTIVPPAGLPRDVVAETIATTPTAVYAKSTKAWTAGDASVTFSYLRRNYKTFTLLAARFDPREGPPSKYVFDADERVHGLPVRHEQFTWRNGDQVMSAVAGEGLSAAEIVKIERAMGGTPVTETWPPRDGSIVKRYRLP